MNKWNTQELQGSQSTNIYSYCPGEKRELPIIGLIRQIS